MTASSAVLDAVVVGSGIAAMTIAPRVLRREANPRRTRVRGLGPGTALVTVVALIFLNQVFFTIYVVSVHGGDASFIAKYLPSGWFWLLDPRDQVVHWLAWHFPSAELLAPSVLRVQAFLELPFVLLAYLVGLRWLDAGLYRRVARSSLIWWAAASYTIVFCAVEWYLRNPYTVDDIVLRVFSAAATPPLIWWMAGRDWSSSAATSVRGLLLFTTSITALGYLVLSVYSTALLYNLGAVPSRIPGITVALIVLALSRWLATRPSAQAAVSTGPAVSTAAAAMRWGLALFFVPALAVRYGIVFGTPWVAAGAALLVALATGMWSLREPWRAGAGFLLVLQLASAIAAAVVVAFATKGLPRGGHYETAVLWAATGALLTGITVCGVTDRALRRTTTAGR